MRVKILLLFFCSIAYNVSFSKERKDSMRITSIIVEPGVVNIDYSNRNYNNSWASAYKVDGVKTTLKSGFALYDSRQNYLPPSIGPFTDQANHYFVTLAKKNKKIQYTLGIVHDKREVVHNVTQQYRYEKGGMELSFLVGLQTKLQKHFSLKNRLGVFVSYNNIHTQIVINTIEYSNVKNKRRFAGYGVVYIPSLEYKYTFSSHWGIFAQINSIMMLGVSKTKVKNTMINKINNISLAYISYSKGVGLGFVYTICRR